MYSLCWGVVGRLFGGLAGVVFLARGTVVDGGGGRVRKCWYPLWIFVKNRVIANGGIGA